MIVSTPPGALVYVNSSKLERPTPTAVEVERGRPYQIEVYRRGFRPWGQRVALGLEERRRRLEIALAKQPAVWGTLQLSATQKADFFLDTRRVGAQVEAVTLAEVRAAVPHRLVVRAPGFRPVERTIRVKPGKVLVLNFALERVDTSVRRK